MERQKDIQVQIKHDSSGNDGPKKRPRSLGVFLIGLVLACSLLFLAANGWYYLQTRPMRATLDQVRLRLGQGLPADSADRDAKTVFYAACARELESLPGRLENLNKQSWTGFVILKDDFSRAELLDTLDQIDRGLAAVDACHQIIGRLEQQIADYGLLAGQPGQDAGAGLPGLLAWYQNRLKAADSLAGLYDQLLALPDVGLAGRLPTREDFGLTEIENTVGPLREPIGQLALLLEAAGALEYRLDELYLQDPSADALADFEQACDQWLADQQTRTAAADALQASLPQPLQEPFARYGQALADRLAFVQTLKACWQSAAKIERSLRAAAIDRQTAWRYASDSLAEPDVQVAFVWTQTAERYRQSMIDTLVFTNIYVAETNQLIGKLVPLRQTYRRELGLDAGGRVLPRYEPVDAVVYWLDE